MKTRFLPLALLCAAALAHADGMPGKPPAAQAESPAVQQKPAPPARTAKRKPRLPRGDLRHCLELGSSPEIIRCAEKPSGR